MKPTKAEVAASERRVRSDGWLSRTPPAFQDAILAGCQWHWFAASDPISHGGDTNGGMFVVASGSISAIPALGAVDAPIVHIASAIFWYGTNPLVDNAPRTMTMVARTRSIVGRVPQHVLLKSLEAEPASWRYIAQHLTDIAILSQLVATDLLIRDSRRRCLAVLLRAAGCRTGTVVSATAELSQDELAAMANLSRQTIGPMLSEFADAGLLTLGYRNIVLHDAAALRGMVDL